jgi:hypothetical protein
MSNEEKLDFDNFDRSIKAASDKVRQNLRTFGIPTPDITDAQMRVIISDAFMDGWAYCLAFITKPSEKLNKAEA